MFHSLYFVSFIFPMLNMLDNVTITTENQNMGLTWIDSFSLRKFSLTILLRICTINRLIVKMGLFVKLFWQGLVFGNDSRKEVSAFDQCFYAEQASSKRAFCECAFWRSFSLQLWPHFHAREAAGCSFAARFHARESCRLQLWIELWILTKKAKFAFCKCGFRCLYSELPFLFFHFSFNLSSP